MDLETAIHVYSLYARTAYAARTAELYEQKMAIVLRILGNVEVEDITANDLNHLMGYLKTEYIPYRFHQTVF